MFLDDDTLKKVTFSNVEDSIFANVSGDATVAAGGALTIAANAVQDSMVNDDVATGLAGNGLAASSGVLSVQVSGAVHVTSDKLAITGSIAGSGLEYAGHANSVSALELDINGLSALGGTGLHQTQDKFLFTDNGTHKTITFSNLEDAIFANVSGDATVAAGGALTIAANAVEGSMLNSNVAGSGLDYGSNELSVDVSDFMSNGANNYLVTATGTDAMNAEANLTFDGTTLSHGSPAKSIAVDVDIRYAHDQDNTVIVEVPVTIPAKAIITKFVVIPKVMSNLGTHVVNVQLSATSGTAADSAISSGTEIIGAGASDQSNSSDTNNLDIELSSGEAAVVLKKVFMKSVDIKVGTSSDVYIYVCNAGTGNGTTNSTNGTLSFYIEYYGID